MFEEEYATLNEIPAAVKHLFVKSGEVFVLLGAAQIKTPDDVNRVQEGLRKEREDHKETKRKLVKFDGMDPAEIHSKLDRFAELEAAADGKLDETKISELVEARLKSQTAPLDRQIASLTTERDTAREEVVVYQGKETRRIIHDHIRKAGEAAKIRSTAMEDALLAGSNIFTLTEQGTVVTRDTVGVTPGVDPSVWFTEIKGAKPHWWPESHGGGATGGDGRSGGGSNPFTHDNWNMTEQGRMVREDPAKAAQMAKSAGTAIGGPKPQKK